MSIILFDKACLYDIHKNETTLYGHYTKQFHNISIEDSTYNLVFCNDRPDFYIKISGKSTILRNFIFINMHEQTNLGDVHLLFPFEDCDLQITPNSAIISTMCKDYSHRLDEWIQYNLKLGFSGIIVFNNDGNKSNPLNENLDNCVQTSSTEDICKKYKGKVLAIEFPYSPLETEDWNNIQRSALHIGVNAFRNKCRNIALIDADEFIYFPNHTNMNIEDFLKNHGTITMMSNILTNKNENDLLNNNILDLAKYIGEDKYTKTILHTEKINENEFIVTPHTHGTQEIINKEFIIHYHCWMNNRYKYNEAMPVINISSDNKL
jgi:hypothetical protein